MVTNIVIVFFLNKNYKLNLSTICYGLMNQNETLIEGVTFLQLKFSTADPGMAGL